MCVWEKKLKSLNRFCSANKIDYCNRGEEKREKEKLKISKRNCRTSQNIRVINVFSWDSAVSVLSLTGNHSPLHLRRMPSNPVWVSGSAVGAAQTLILSYSCVFLPPLSTDVRTSAFSFVEALNDLLDIP